MERVHLSDSDDQAVFASDHDLESMKVVAAIPGKLSRGTVRLTNGAASSGSVSPSSSTSGERRP